MKLSDALRQADSSLTKLPSSGIPVSAGKGDDRVETVIDDVPLPVSLQAMVRILGEKPTFRLALNSLVVAVQGEVRPNLKKKNGQGRKKAAYLEEIGL